MPSGVETKEQSDSTTLITDYDNRYQITLPKGWVVVPLSGRDITKILSDLAKEISDANDLAKTIQQLDPNSIRAMAFNSDRKYIAGGFATNITIAFTDKKLVTSLPLTLVASILEESLKQYNATILPRDESIKNNTNEVEIGIVGNLLTTSNAAGKKLRYIRYPFYFKSNNNLIIITLATPKQFGDELLPELDQIIDSIKLLKP